MHRFYLSPEECAGTTLTLTEREAHHAAQVLRLRRGDSASVLDGAGNQFHCRVEDVSKKNVLLAVEKKESIPPLSYNTTLIQAVPKGKLMESIIQKATELGVRRIIPLLTERVTTQLDATDAEDKREKWQMTAIEAIKQCGQTWLPQVETPVSLPTFLARNEKFDLPLIGCLAEGSRNPRSFFEGFRSKQKKEPQTIAVWIGPEGDFSANEMKLVLDSGVLPMTLGRLVLRCETAAIYSLSLVNYEMQSAS